MIFLQIKNLMIIINSSWLRENDNQYYLHLIRNQYLYQEKFYQISFYQLLIVERED